MQGTTVDSKYKIVRELGQGGMGAVYEAQHLGTGRRVALKVIVPTALVTGGDMIARFQREARASGAIDSQHVVQVLDTGVDRVTESPYLVMEYLTGEDLQQVIRRIGALPVEVVLRIIAQACNGLTRAHEQGIVHRDIKAANIFVARREAGELMVKILDFGIAKVRADPMSSTGNQSITRTGALLGSPLYMSPEQVLGAKDIDPRADVFSLGVTMYEALCGYTPNHECETVGMLVVAICGGRGKPLLERAPSLPRDVVAIVEKALAIDPAARFQSTAEMRAAVTALLPRGTDPKLDESMLGPGAIQTRSTPPLAQTPQGLTVPLVDPARPGSARPSAPVSESPPAAVAATATSFTESASLPLRKTPRWLLAVPVLGLLLGAGALGFYRLRANASQDFTPAISASPTQTLASPTSAGATGPLSPIGAIDATDASTASTSAGDDHVDASVIVVGALPSATTALRPLVGTGGTGATGGPGDGRAQPHAQAQPAVQAPKTLVPATPPKTNCDPPFTFNSDGKKIWKRDCL